MFEDLPASKDLARPAREHEEPFSSSLAPTRSQRPWSFHTSMKMCENSISDMFLTFDAEGTFLRALLEPFKMA